ncbi:hypothetical protein CTEN210_03523 [Chaetoceros tenuissimus]|uniref:Leucine-rich repeat domain-containing protein n=1 Tax=Chaetoceros tenuissimus TaxID=426638 RepID=A0AAD3CJH7_9STRA|nr:hypothetical protein CTEN210_03523 [Chaetoceros tenuissimus]
MRVQTEEWRRFIPGVRMYKGKKTLFYNGETLVDGWTGDWLIYNGDERQSWEVIIVLPGVEIIPERTFRDCFYIETVIMANTVRRMESGAFNNCMSLVFIKLSRNLEFIGSHTFWCCKSLTSIFIPPSCTEIGDYAFYGCVQLLILGIPQQVEVGEFVFHSTALIRASTLENADDETVVQWVKSINNGETYDLHRACSSSNPIAEIIHALVNQHGIRSMKMPNTIGITPSQYLAANTFADISEKEIINRYISEMMGETV